MRKTLRCLCDDAPGPGCDALDAVSVGALDKTHAYVASSQGIVSKAIVACTTVPDINGMSERCLYAHYNEL